MRIILIQFAFNLQRLPVNVIICFRLGNQYQNYTRSHMSAIYFATTKKHFFFT